MKTISFLGLFAALSLVSCDDSKTTKKTADEAELVALKEKLEALNNELDSGAGDHAMLIAKYEVAIDSLENSVEELNDRLESAEAKRTVGEVKVEADSAKVEPEKVEEEVRIISMDEIKTIRAAAVGETYDELNLSMGRVYYDVRITGVDEVGVRFTHRNGAARIDYMSLPVAWKERFHFDFQRFVKAQKAERMARHRWEKAVDERLAELREEKREQEDKARIAKLELELAEAKRPVNITQVTTNTRRSNSPFDGGYSTVLYPSYNRSWSSSNCPPVISSGRRSVSVPGYCPSPIVGTPVVRPPVVRTPVVRTPVCPTPVRSVPTVRSAPTARPRYWSR